MLFRHGESVWNVKDSSLGLKVKFTGWADIALTARGVEQAAAAGRCLEEFGVMPTTVCTSLLRRSRESYDEIAKVNNYANVTVINSWRLNERHYGALVGLGKEEAMNMFDPKQVMEWRKSWDKKPPKMNNLDLKLWNKAAWTKPVTIVSEPGKQKAVISEIGVSLPETESLEDCCNRVRPLWYLVIAPKVKLGETVLIVAHANSIRAMVRYIDFETISTDSVREISIPPATPLVYDFALRHKPLHASLSMDPAIQPGDVNLGHPDGKLYPLGVPTPLGMRGRFIVNRELAKLKTTAKLSSFEDQICVI